MKTYTFKIKLHYASQAHPAILSVVHCPLEVLFDSLKQLKEFEDLYKILKDPSNKEVPYMYVTASDYVNNDGEYIHDDYLFCEFNAILESNSLKDLLTHSYYYGFVEAYSSAIKTEYERVCEIFEQNKAIKEKLKSEVDEGEI